MFSLPQIKKIFAAVPLFKRKKEPSKNSYTYRSPFHTEPLRKLSTSLNAHHLARSGPIKGVESIFLEPPGFLREFVGFQNDVAG
jgi:hypothetical protein